MTSRRRTRGASGASAAEQERRDQEVLRANRELAAYFKGRRTEREARAALKIIKAFVRDRERRDAQSLPPLPGAGVATPAKPETPRRRSRAPTARRRKTPTPTRDAAPIQPADEARPSPASESGEHADE